MTDFSRIQATAVKELLARSPQTRSSGKAEQFLLQFVFLEALIRLVGQYYRERNVSSKKSSKFEPLNIDVVGRSLAYFRIELSDADLVHLLDSKLNKRGYKSARNLRNGLVHQWKIEDMEEVVSRFDSLIAMISRAIRKIQSRANFEV